MQKELALALRMSPRMIENLTGYGVDSGLFEEVAQLNLRDCTQNVVYQLNLMNISWTLLSNFIDRR